MSLSIYNIKRWIKMFLGTSIEHVDQGVGKLYSKFEIKGYYNDLTQKVLKTPKYEELLLPKLQLQSGEKVYFPISIFQYGLGAYDLYLLEGKIIYLEIFKKCVDWALDNQNINGSWDTFFFKDVENSFSAMAQGEGISLLIRAYSQFSNLVYLEAAKKAMHYMIKPVEENGTTYYNGDKVFLLEISNQPVILNGWIFAIFGIYDYLIINNYDVEIEKIYIDTIYTLVENLALFDKGYWSKYDIDNMIASPFYHELHIAQLEVLYDLTGIKDFKGYSLKWEDYRKSKSNYFHALMSKAIQKVF